MEYEFKDKKTYQRLFTDGRFTSGFPSHIVSKFRQRMQQIAAAPDEKDFYNLKSLCFKKLKGDRSTQYSMRLNDQWRLVLELINRNGKKIVLILGIEDYH